MKILIADDSEFMRKVLRDILERAGFSQFVECDNGNACLKTYQAEKPDLILLDIIMPEKSGMEVLGEIGKKATVIVISSIGQEKMIAEAKQLGAKGYVVKPFESKQVMREITKVMG